MVFLLRPTLDTTVPLDPSDRNAVMASLLRMKEAAASKGIATNGVPVGVHPVFFDSHRSQGGAAEFLDELQRLLSRHCLEDRYFLTAVMFTDLSQVDEKEHWVWQKGNVKRVDGKVKIVFGGIPGLEGLKEQEFNSLHMSRGSAAIVPRSTMPKTGLQNSAIEAILRESKRIDPDAAIDGVKATDRLENPELVSVQMDDCASCHVASNAREYAIATLDRTMDRSLAYRFNADPRLTARLDDMQYLLHRADRYRPMSFAFFDRLPSVSVRTMHESLQAACVVNRLLDAESR